MIGNNGKPVMFTPEGGVAVWMINKTGAPSWKGAVVDTHGSVANAVRLVPVDVPDAMGIIYDDGVADGDLVRVVFAGAAEVFYVGSVSLRYFARITTAADTGDEAGKAIAEPFPTAPFSTDKHFMEIGHTRESRVGAGLALTMLHFN